MKHFLFETLLTVLDWPMTTFLQIAALNVIPSSWSPWEKKQNDREHQDQKHMCRVNGS